MLFSSILGILRHNEIMEEKQMEALYYATHSNPSMHKVFKSLKDKLQNYCKSTIIHSKKHRHLEVKQIIKDIDNQSIVKIPQIIARLKVIENPPTGSLADLITEVQGTLFRHLGKIRFGLIAYDSQDASDFSEAIGALDPEQTTQILLIGGYEGHYLTMLMRAMTEYHWVVDNLLKSLVPLSKEQKNRVLSPTSPQYHHYNVLMFAIKYHATAVGPILKLMETMDIDVIANILSNRSWDDHENSLMIAAKTHPHSFKRLVDFINQFLSSQPNLIINILFQVSRTLDNILTIVARSCPEHVHLILDLANSLKRQDLSDQLLLHANTDGKMAVDLVPRLHPAYELLYKATIAARDRKLPQKSTIESSNNPSTFFASAPSFNEVTKPKPEKTTVSTGNAPLDELQEIHSAGEEPEEEVKQTRTTQPSSLSPPCCSKDIPDSSFSSFMP